MHSELAVYSRRIALTVRTTLVVCVLLATVLAAGQEGSPLRLELQRFLVIEQQQDGEQVETLVPALELQPGDTMEESLTALNVSDRSLGDIQLVVPIAVNTAYLAGSASELLLAATPVEPEFSFDNGLTFAHPPLKRTIVVIENGIRTESEVVVEPQEYTHVRWSIPVLAPEQDVVVAFRAVVE